MNNVILSPIAMYDRLKADTSGYKEEIHCPMVIEIITQRPRVSAFCTEALISEKTFYQWLYGFELFNKCYRIALLTAKELWEKEKDDNELNPDFDYKKWKDKGTRVFWNNKDKLFLEINPLSSPWEQYQQIMRQASHGAFSATEIKLLMEAINVGRNVYESYKMQEEIDRLKEDLNVALENNNGNNSTANNKAKEND